MKNIRNKFLLAGIAGCSLLLSSCYKKFDASSYAPALNIGGFTSTAEIAKANLVGYWAFNGSLIDSVSGTSGVNSGTSFSTGIKGQCMQGANNGYVLFTPGAAITSMTSFTITYWVNSPVNTSAVGLVGLSNTANFWGNIDMFFENGSTADAAKFRAHFTNNGGTTEHWISKDGIPGLFNTWNSLGFSYDAATKTFKMYINGTVTVTEVDNAFGALNFMKSGKMVFGTVQFQTTPSLTSNTGSQSWAGFLTGQLDEVRFYNKALTDNELNALVKLEGRGK